ncbi:MAG: hypothetical protein E7660_01580 [Ruminococcaceae bacterium]|nr:hypothetical protein [Oscillospiraceae bacterium]
MKKYMIIEAPVCVGAPTVGTEEAYSALKSDLKSLFQERATFADFEGDRVLPEVLLDKRLIGYETVMNVSKGVREKYLEAFEKGYIPVTLGGDHSVVMGALAAVGETFGAENVALIYIDGHTDINTENTTLSGRIHGLPLAAAMGLCTPLLDVGKNRVDLYGRNTYIVGAHSIDPEEWGIMEKEGVTLYSPHAVRKLGYEKILSEILETVKDKKVHISLDVDVMDGSEFPATGYVMPGGLTFETVLNMMKFLSEKNVAVSLDFVEYNPSRDKDGSCKQKMLKLFETL